MTKTATKILDLLKWHGHAYLYRMEPPLEGQAFVIVSAITAYDGQPETFIFPANSDGDELDMLEMTGSRRGTLSHEEVLKGLGYEIVSGE